MNHSLLMFISSLIGGAIGYSMALWFPYYSQRLWVTMGVLCGAAAYELIFDRFLEK